MNRLLKQSIAICGVGLFAFATSCFGDDRALNKKFDECARSWEEWCDKNRFNSNFKELGDHESVRELQRMGKGIVPMVFERWKQLPDDSNLPPQPPWWIVLEHICEKKMVSDEEKLADFSPEERAIVRPENIEKPTLQEQRWRAWWKREGQRQFSKP
jgi:hypothetical protein